MDDHFIPLVIFTLLVQASAGIFLSTVPHSWISKPKSDKGMPDKRLILTSFILLIIALFVSFLHLGTPLNAVNSLRGSQTSWLSKEILAVILTTGTLGLNTILIWSGSKREFTSRLDLLSAIFFIALLFSMSKVYMLPSVPGWNSWTTPGGFTVTVLLCALLIIAGPGLREKTALPLYVAAALSVLISLSIFIGFSGVKGYTDRSYTIPIIRLILALISITSLFISTISTIGQNKRALLFVVICVAVAVSEAAARVQFFILYDYPGQ